MKRRFLFLLLVLLPALLMAGCGSGSSSRSVKARSVGQVKITIALPAAIRDKLAGAGAGTVAGSSRRVSRPFATSKALAADKTGSRIIPNNTAQVSVTYNVFTTDPSNNTASIVGVSPKTLPVPITGSTLTPTLSDVIAGVPNTISVAITDAHSVKIATGSATVNIAPGSAAADNQINITLVSTVTGELAYTLDGGAMAHTLNGSALLASIMDVRTHVLRVASIANTDGVAVMTIAPTSLTWTSLNPDYLSVTQNVDGSATIQQLKPSATPVRIQLDYAEPETDASGKTNLHNIHSYTLTFSSLSAALSSQATQTITQTAPPSGVNVPQANVYDVTDNGYALFYDANRTTSLAGTGYSRIVQYALPAQSSVLFAVTPLVDFDSASSPTYVGAGSRTAFFSIGAANYWATIKGDGSQIVALASGQSRSTGTPLWTYAYGGFKILDVDVKGGNVLLLEQITNTDGYQIEYFPQNSTGTITTVTGTISLADLNFTPVNLAVIATAQGVDCYLTSATRIAQVHVLNGAVTSINANFAAISNLRDIAATATDSRFVYVLTTTDARVLSTSDGSPVTIPQTLAGTGRRLSAFEVAVPFPTGFGPGSSYVYALEDNGGASQIQGFQLP